MKNLPIYTVKERRPFDGEFIYRFGNVYGFGLEQFEINYTPVEYCWMVVNDYGDTGVQLLYEEGKQPEENVRLMLLDCGGVELVDSDIYGLTAEVDQVFRELSCKQ